MNKCIRRSTTQRPLRPGSCIDRTLLLPLGVALLEPEATRSAICMAEEGQFGSLVLVWNHWVFLGQKTIQPCLYLC